MKTEKWTVRDAFKVIFTVLVTMFLSAFSVAETNAFSSAPDHVILFIIDGLSYKVWDRMDLPVLGKMAGEGTLVEKMYLPPAAHPKTGVYATLHSSSIPNPIMMSGTVFIDEKTEYIQQKLFPGQITAFVANTYSYETLNRYYHYSYQRPGDDAESVHWALTFMEEGEPAFMRVHLQQAGGAGSMSMNPDSNESWRFDIWHGESPYRRTVATADSLLGVLVRGLESSGILSSTAIIVLGDHGQNDTGWHPLQFVDSSITTAVIWGAGVKPGVRVPYAELIDVVPTLSALLGCEVPKTSIGRPIVEALGAYSGPVLPQKRLISEMLDQFTRYRTSMAEATYLLEQIDSGAKGALYSSLERNVRENFYDISTFTLWPRFDSLEALIENNGVVLARLDELLVSIRTEADTTNKRR